MRILRYLKIEVIATLGLLLFVSSCELDNRVWDTIVADKYEFQDGDLAAITGSAYAPWRRIALDWDGLTDANDATSDQVIVATKPWGWNDGGIWPAVHYHNWESHRGPIVALWNKIFEGVNNTNRALFTVEETIPDSPEKLIAIAELRVLRASYYYLLCDLFGNVPIINTFDLPEGFLPEQSPRKEVYEFIVNEITEVLPDLSEERNQTTYGRFNSKWSALALLAKMYLNAEVYTGTAQWDKCLEVCDEIIDSGLFSLAANQKDNFKVDNENSPEAIFSIVYDEQRAFGNVIFKKTMNGQHQSLYQPIGGSGYGGPTMIPQFISTFDEDDARLTENHIYGPQLDAQGNVTTCSCPNPGDPFIIENSLVSVEDVNDERYGYRLGKFEFAIELDPQRMDNDFHIFRYTDVLMMKAECLLRDGKAGEAAAIVTEVRERSFMSAPEKAEVTGAQLLGGSVYNYGLYENGHVILPEGGDDIQYGGFLDELGWEFAQEGRRRQDLIRFGVFTTKSWASKQASFNSNEILFQIPNEAIASNPNLDQNPR